MPLPRLSIPGAALVAAITLFCAATASAQDTSTLA